MNAKSERKATYSVVVENPNSWDATTGIHEITAHCGHRHKSADAAERCLASLTRWYCIHGKSTTTAAGYPARCSACTGGLAQPNSTSARWYGASIRPAA